MKKALCLLLSVVFTAAAFFGCSGQDATTTTTTDNTATEPGVSETEPTVTDAPDPIVHPVIDYNNNTDIELPDYVFLDTVTTQQRKLAFKNAASDAEGFGLYISATSKGAVVTFPKDTVAGVYTTYPASETEKTTYTFDLKCGEREDDYTWFTCYFGLRLLEEKSDPLPHTGVWLAMRSKQIGMRTNSWPETKYMKCDFDFSKGETVTVVDDPVNNVITVYGGAEKKEIAVIKIDGKKVEMYAPGADSPSIRDVVAENIIKGGYAHLWNHNSKSDVTAANVTATLLAPIIETGDNDGIKQNTRDIFSDTYVSYDDVGRAVASSGVAPNEKKVGIFYFLWHEDTNNRNPLYDHTAAYEKGGITELNKVFKQGSLGYAHYWGEPYFGYYCSNDEWVIRKHGAMLSEAGVDFVYFDATNGPLYKRMYEAVLKVWSQMRKEGLKTPDVCFILKDTNAAELGEIWGDLYKTGHYEDMWFRWLGKPVIMFTDSGYKLTKEQEEFFTVRISWATEASGWYREQNGIGCWPWASMYKQKPGYRRESGSSNRIVEQMSVMCGFWANGSYGTNAGRSYTKATGEPKNLSVGDWNYGFGLYPQTSGLGLAYQECFDYALEKSPELIMITGWNEWWAGRWEEVGHTIAYEVTSTFENKSIYVDNFNPEYSRDIEPMKGGFNDNYYYQTVINVRKYKGSRNVEAAFGQSSIDINGDITQWFTVGPEFRDVTGDTAKRDHVSYAGKLRYTNDTGRNDILTAKVSSDGTYLYFYVECDNDITAREGDNWMNLFIKSDDNETNGWYGFDYIINRSGDGGNCSVEKFGDGWSFESVGDAEYKQDGKTLVIKVDAVKIGYNGKSLDFKWADNSVKDGDIMKFLDEGDSAPDARFCYRFTTKATENEVPACLTADMAVFKVNGYNAYIDGRQQRLDNGTKATLLASGYEFYLPVSILNHLGIDCTGEQEYNHYGVKYVKANDAVQKSGKVVTVTPDGLLIIANEKITDEKTLTTLYRALY